MLETKYLLIIGAIVCILVCYYFYDEISNAKKILLPTYQKTMSLEAKITALEEEIKNHPKNISNPKSKKKNSNLTPHPKKHTDSPALSITYQSDLMHGNGTGTDHYRSARYSDINDSEVVEIRKNINPYVNNNFNPTQINKFSTQINPKINVSPPNKSNQLNKSQPSVPDPSYQKILDGLSIEAATAGSDDQFDIISSAELDLEVVKHISDTAHIIDLEQNNMSELSDIPIKQSHNQSQSHLSEISDFVFNQRKNK